MAPRLPLVRVSGRNRQMPSGDAVPVAAGGTGATTPTTARAALGLGSAALMATLGTAVSGGASGAIIEKGSNANGAYIRFADGTQICWIRFSFANQTVTQTGSIFRGPSTLVGNFPAAFSDTPAVMPGGTSGAGGGWIAQDIYQSATSWGYWSTRHAVSDGNAGVISLIAIGRWY